MAWYSKQDAKRAQTDKAKVMAPYNLYLLNPDAQDLLQFAVGNLHPGEKKETVICVSNHNPNEKNDMSELAKDSKFGYDLMLVYTENLAINYSIYPLEKHDWPGDGDPNLDENAYIMDDRTMGVCYWTKKTEEVDDQKKEITLDGKFMTGDMRKSVGTDQPGIVNAGAYWISTDDTMELEYKAGANGEGKYEYDYYLIEIDWDKNINFDSYRKETDMVFVVVNAKQPRPILENK